ncbi:hypothetical protein C5E11_03835 [Clavibacter michiganensis]|nr:hypothetical protein [Clavibacter michiganensis]PPF64532.1 hypothetical protein C5E11_03835 [Clavibacter michiganensis]
MSIVDGTGLVAWEGGLFEPGSDLLARTRWAFNYIRERGGTIKLNEAGRPFGVYSDRYVEDASDTASGLSTVHFQWGRFLRGETPSAADPAGGIYASDHTKGLATDTNASDIKLRAEAMSLVGMVQTIDSETWHFAIRHPSQVDLTGWNTTGETPNEGFLMSLSQTDQNNIAEMAAAFKNAGALQDIGGFTKIGVLVNLLFDLRELSGTAISTPYKATWADVAISRLKADTTRVDILKAIKAVADGDPVEIDEKVLATELAPLISANLGTLSKASIDALAKAVADEQSKRLAS